MFIRSRRRLESICRFIGFVNSGFTVEMIVTEGKEIACNFTMENCFFTYAGGVSINVACHMNFIAVEDVEMLVMSKEKL